MPHDVVTTQRIQELSVIDTTLNDISVTVKQYHMSFLDTLLSYTPIPTLSLINHTKPLSKIITKHRLVTDEVNSIEIGIDASYVINDYYLKNPIELQSFDTLTDPYDTFDTITTIEDVNVKDHDYYLMKRNIDITSNAHSLFDLSNSIPTLASLINRMNRTIMGQTWNNQHLHCQTCQCQTCQCQHYTNNGIWVTIDDGNFKHDEYSEYGNNLVILKPAIIAASTDSPSNRFKVPMDMTAISSDTSSFQDVTDVSGILTTDDPTHYKKGKLGHINLKNKTVIPMSERDIYVTGEKILIGHDDLRDVSYGRYPLEFLNAMEECGGSSIPLKGICRVTNEMNCTNYISSENKVYSIKQDISTDDVTPYPETDRCIVQHNSSTLNKWKSLFTSSVNIFEEPIEHWSLEEIEFHVREKLLNFDIFSNQSQLGSNEGLGLEWHQMSFASRITNRNSSAIPSSTQQIHRLNEESNLESNRSFILRDDIKENLGFFVVNCTLNFKPYSSDINEYIPEADRITPTRSCLYEHHELTQLVIPIKQSLTGYQSYCEDIVNYISGIDTYIVCKGVVTEITLPPHVRDLLYEYRHRITPWTVLNGEYKSGFIPLELAMFFDRPCNLRNNYLDNLYTLHNELERFEWMTNTVYPVEQTPVIQLIWKRIEKKHPDVKQLPVKATRKDGTLFMLYDNLNSIDLRNFILPSHGVQYTSYIQRYEMYRSKTKTKFPQTVKMIDNHIDKYIRDCYGCADDE